MIGVYLAAARARHNDYNIIYNDYDKKFNCDLTCDMMSVDLEKYDFVIASPPCNYWSIARGNRLSDYSKNTKHLLPDIIDKCINLGKPFIIENVKNNKRFLENNLFNKKCYCFIVGRHTYWTNLYIPDIQFLHQRQDFKTHGKVIKYNDMIDNYHQGGYNVYVVIEYFLNYLSKILD